MNAEPRDDIDRAIDDALASFAAAEPRRVSAASVREAMVKTRPKRLPLWLAMAAALILGLLMNRREILPAQNPPKVAVTDPAATSPTLRPVTSPNPGETQSGVERASDARSRPQPQAARTLAASGLDSPSYEGLPRLTIAPIDFSPETATVRLDTDAIETTGLEIAPLVVPSLSPEPENR